jgi:hypothetical protein
VRLLVRLQRGLGQKPQIGVHRGGRWFGGAQRGLERGRVELQLVGRPAVGEGVDPDRPVGAAHHLRLAKAVGHALQRVGQGLADEAVRLAHHVGDRGAADSRVVKGELDAR